MATAALQLGYFGEFMLLNIRQGADFGPILAEMENPDLTPVNLTGCVIRGQIRQKALDPKKVADITVTITNAAAGEYQFGLTATQTAAIKAGETSSLPASRYVWDLELQDAAGRITPLYYGDVIVLREVTRA